MAITKCINSESKQYKPVLTDKLVLDAVPTVNSLNSVTSDAVARAIAGASGEVPQVTENDNGKILTAIYDEGGPAVSWEEAPSGVPEYSSADEGKVLGVVVNGVEETPELDWVDAGSSYTAGEGIAIENDEVSVKAGTGLEIGNVSGQVTTQTVGLTEHTIVDGGYDMVYVVQSLTPEIFAAISNDAAAITLSTIPVTDPSYTNWSVPDGSGKTAYVGIAKLKQITLPNTTGWEIDTTKVMFLGVAVQTLDSSGAVPTNVAYNVHESDNTDADSTLTWSELTTALAGGTISDYAICIASKNATIFGTTPAIAMCSHITGVVGGQIATGSITYTATVTGALKVSNPVPSYAVGDANKVLTVNAGATGIEWATPSGGACNMVKIDPSQTTFAQIAAIMEAGSIPYYYYGDSTQIYALMLPDSYINGEMMGIVSFRGIAATASTMMVVYIQSCFSNDTWSAVSTSYVTMSTTP